MEYFLQPMETPLSLVLLTVAVDVTLNSINVSRTILSVILSDSMMLIW